eukprot:6199289-Pyramimonas_sp.AAC.1
MRGKDARDLEGPPRGETTLKGWPAKVARNGSKRQGWKGTLGKSRILHMRVGCTVYLYGQKCGLTLG